jgi:hypothetical protein
MPVVLRQHSFIATMLFQISRLNELVTFSCGLHTRPDSFKATTGQSLLDRPVRRTGRHDLLLVSSSLSVDDILADHYCLGPERSANHRTIKLQEHVHSESDSSRAPEYSV